MKSSILNAVLASMAFAAPVFGAPEKAEEVAPKYKNRLSVSPNSVSYERTAEDSLFFGFEYSRAPAFREKNIDVDVTTTSLKIGQSFSIDPRSRITPALGASMFRDEGTAIVYHQVKDEMGHTTTREFWVKNPFMFHGTFGLNAEYDLVKSVTLGLNVHGMCGGVWGGKIDKMGDMSWGMNASLPITFRMGTDAHWDVRMEPFALLLKDYANYVGGKAALGYRF